MTETVKDKVGLAVLGAGRVGTGVLDHFMAEKDRLCDLCGSDLDLRKILVRSLPRTKPLNAPRKILCTDVNDVLDDPSVNLVISLVGGEEAENKFIFRSLRSGRSVVTANKLVVAKSGPDLLKTAQENGAGFFYEAAVGGGIQVIDNLLERYSHNSFTSINGILNGTTNYILTEMSKGNGSFDEILKQAQDEGYAEADPSSDVEGLDASYKIAILASLAFRKGWVYPHYVYAEGIRNIYPRDFESAERFGYVIKLVASAVDLEGKVEAWVAPTYLPKKHFLAGVDGALNGVLIKGKPVGEVRLQGQGAGGDTTAASVWSDVIKACRHLRDDRFSDIRHTQKSASVIPFDQSRHPNCIRMTIVDRLHCVGEMGHIMGDNGVSINQIIQLDNGKWEGGDGASLAEIALDLDPSGEGDIDRALKGLTKVGICRRISSRFRVTE